MIIDSSTLILLIELSINMGVSRQKKLTGHLGVFVISLHSLFVSRIYIYLYPQFVRVLRSLLFVRVAQLS